MSKFKVGDRVRTTDSMYCGVVTHFCQSGLPVMDTDADQVRGWPEGQLVLVDHSGDDPTTLTRRDHFAMAALTGLLAYSSHEGTGSCHNNSDVMGAAVAAYDYADAMEAARNKEGAE